MSETESPNRIFFETPPPGVDLTLGRVTLRVLPREEFVFYASLIAAEYDPLDIRPGETVLDAGANIGDFTIQASIMAGPEGNVVAVEPNPRVLPYLEWNLKVNRCSNVEIVPCALGSPGKAVLIETSDGGSVGSVIARQGVGIEVPTRSIDEVFSSLGLRTPDVVKMDIEGAEGEALTGFQGLSRVRTLAVELHGTDNLLRVPKLLQENFETWYETPADVWKRTLRNVATHPLDFVIAEFKSRFVATKGVLGMAAGRGHPVPSVRGDQLAIIYARHRNDTLCSRDRSEGLRPP
jgi:FkbM family methyltransferase